MNNFRYADIHCHPNLKTFGHSFDKRKNSKADMWFHSPATLFAKQLHRFTGVTKFSQANFTLMARSDARIILLSLYPFEKGFFTSPGLPPKVAAMLADWGIEIGYQRIRHLQKHTDYFRDLQDEYQFVLNSEKKQLIGGVTQSWQLADNWEDVEEISRQENTIAVILTIEGAHVFNSGLGDFGVEPDEKNILSNISKVKGWEHPPLFIGLAHNFNNDLCGHARSLQRLGKLVDQTKNMESGLSELGIKVIHALLDNQNGRPIFIDLKHMSLLSRQQYMQLLEEAYPGRQVPLIVSHGSVTGLSFGGYRSNTGCLDIFNPESINFYDEEIIAIARSGGLFGLQMDMGIHTDLKKIKINMTGFAGETPIRRSARIIWNQLQHIAGMLDAHGLFCWGNTSVGSDFDGSINPFPGILTVEGFEPLSRELKVLAREFLCQQTLSLPANNQLSPEEIIDLFLYGNLHRFLKNNYA
jgi:microsomal dipeptidase-like Zn-dependent dipeptidase